MTPVLIAALLFPPGILVPRRIFANLGRMGRCLFEPRRMRLGHDQHRQPQSVHHSQGVLEIDALAVLELGQHADGYTAMPRRLVNGHPFPSPRCANAVAQLVNGGSLILVQFTGIAMPSIHAGFGAMVGKIFPQINTLLFALFLLR
ncbi:hypothetical protein D9M68_745870 [compost metagenome]